MREGEKITVETAIAYKENGAPINPHSPEDEPYRAALRALFVRLEGWYPDGEYIWRDGRLELVECEIEALETDEAKAIDPAPALKKARRHRVRGKR